VAQAFADEQLQAVLAEALHELEDLLHSDDPRVKLKAAVVILDRTLGRPGQRLEHAGSIELRRGLNRTPPRRLGGAGET
jgi:hypothetical protein